VFIGAPLAHVPLAHGFSRIPNATDSAVEIEDDCVDHRAA